MLRINNLLLLLLIFTASCHNYKDATQASKDFEASDFIESVYFQKAVAGSPEDSSHYFLHLITRDTLPEKVELRSITFMYQVFKLNPFQTTYKFKLKPPEQGLHQKGSIRYVNKSEEVTVVKPKSLVIPIPRKEDIFLP